MAGTPIPPPYQTDWKYQRRLAREQVRLQRDLQREQWKHYRLQQRAQYSRRGSVLGPLLVIALGIVFFLVSLHRLDYGTLGGWYARWWPLLLLLGGVVLLAEWAFDRSRASANVYPHRVGGGVVTLVILICIPGILLNASHGDPSLFRHGFGVNPDNIDEFLGDRHESDQSLDQPISPTAHLSIDNPHGDIVLTGTSSDNQIHVAVHKQVFSRSDTEATEKSRRLAPALTSSGNSVALILPSIDGTRADLTVTVPAGVVAILTANHGNIQGSFLKAPLTLTANHGDIELENIDGPVNAHINNRSSSFNARGLVGALSLEGNCHDVDVANVAGDVSLRGDFFGTTHLERVGGMVRFHTSRTDFQLARLDGEVEIKHGDLTGDQILGPVTVTARSYNVTLDRVAGDVSVATSDGSVDLTSAAPLGNVTIQNRNGMVNVTVPEHAAFTVQAETRDGDVETEFPLAKTDENNVSRLTGSVGSGGSLIRINTSQNDISLKKGAVAPLGPLPAPQPPITLLPSPPPPAPPTLPRKAHSSPMRSQVTTF